MRFNFQKLSYKLWAYFALFTVAILGVLWLLQTVFLQSFYEGMKTKAVIQAANGIAEAYQGEDFSKIRELAYINSLEVRLFDDKQQLIYVPDVPGYGRVQPRDFAQFTNNLFNAQGDTVCYTVNNPEYKGKSVIYGAIIRDADTQGIQAVLYVNSPLDPVDSTTQVLKTQLLYVTIVAFLLGLAMAFFMARRVSRPITRITASASELARGNYGVVFEKGDYAEIDELAATLNYTATELSKVGQMQRDLIANVSHDLRTPLTMVKAYGEMIRDLSGDNPSKRNDHVKVIIDEANRLSVLVNDILDLSKLQAGNMPLQTEDFDLGQEARNILDRVRVVEQDGYQFEAQFESGCRVLADKNRIQQVMYNLLANAIHYTGADNRVVVRVERRGIKTRFEVRDTGPGIPEDQLEVIWERYYRRSSASHQRDAVGTGLGLSIVKSILEQHHAAFGVDSQEGVGSVFWFELDCCETDNQRK